MVDAVAPGHIYWPAALATLSQMLRGRFLRTGSLDDMRESVELARQAAVANADDPDRASWVYDLAMALEYRSTMTGSRAEHDEALALMRDVVAGYERGRPIRATLLNGLARCCGHGTGRGSGRTSGGGAALAGLAEAAQAPSERASLLATCHEVLAAGSTTGGTRPISIGPSTASGRRSN